MKKLFVLVVSALFVFGCAEEVEFNTPALQGDKNGVLWRADFYSAEINAGGQLVINGGKGYESVVLRVSSASEGTYILGAGNSSEGLFYDSQDLEHSTNNEPDPSVQLYPADGEIIIDDYDATSNVVSGSFWYNAFSATGLNKVNLSQGVFYRIPVRGGTGTVIVSCDDAVADTADALAVYEATDEMSTDYPTVCDDYKEALMQQIISCGDDTNVLQDIIDGLDCTLSCDNATANTAEALLVYESTDTSSSEFPTVCNDYKAALEQQIESCGDDMGVLQTIIDGLDCGAVVVPGGCQTCTHATVPTTEFCDNGDGTMTVTITGFPPSTLDLAGTTFAEYISGLESGGYTCE